MTDRYPLPAYCFALLLAIPAQGLAQASIEASPRAKPTMVRGWLFPAGDKQAVSLNVKPAGEEMGITLASSKDGAAASNPAYSELPLAGNFTMELKSGEEVLASKTGVLRPERHYTALAWSKGGKWELQVFADDPASPNAMDRPLRVINFAGGRQTLLAVGDSQEAKVEPDSVQEFRAPGQLAMVRVQVLASDGGPPAQSSVEVDFSSSPSAYVLVGPDYRGRMRPRVIEGGATPPEPAASVGVPEAQQ